MEFFDVMLCVACSILLLQEDPTLSRVLCRPIKPTLTLFLHTLTVRDLPSRVHRPLCYLAEAHPTTAGLDNIVDPAGVSHVLERGGGSGASQRVFSLTLIVSVHVAASLAECCCVLT